MADQIFGSSSVAVMHYMGEIFVFVNFVISRDGGIVAYGAGSFMPSTSSVRLHEISIGKVQVAIQKFKHSPTLSNLTLSETAARKHL